MQRIFLFLISSCFWYYAGAQDIISLSLPEAYQLSKANYPAWQQRNLLKNATEVQLKKLERTKLPEVNWIAKGSLQTHTVSVPFAPPGGEPIKLPLVNIQTYGEANYLIYDGGQRAAQEAFLQSKLDTDIQTLELDWQNRKAQINQSFFAALLLRKQKEMAEITKKDLNQRKDFLKAGFDNGVVLESDLLKMEVQIQHLQSQLNGFDADHRAAIQSLAYLLGQSLSDSVRLVSPGISSDWLAEPLKRPELAWFALQKQQILTQEKLIDVQSKPKLSAFARLGLGYPDPLDFFDDRINPFGIAGVQMSWRFWDWGQSDLDRQLLTVQSQIIDNKKETFEYTINAVNSRYQEEVAKIKTLILEDEKIEKLEVEIAKQMAAQLEHGVITTTEYLEQANATLKARLQLQTHQVQLQQTIADYWMQRGKW